jgi:uncharacterized LabA/DUF88 family protein
MGSSHENVSMALFCDFENVALGVRDANYEKFDIKPVLERLLLKGSIVIKKAYCDWDRYKGFKAAMHEANFELIEIPHVRQSGKNSADIRLVVDALDLCYTKSHLDTFVIISGDSDFSPLVSKLRENAKYVIGVGVKQSTSDLLIANCDEFIFYDDLVRESQRAAAKRDSRDNAASPRRSPEDERRRKEEWEARRTKAVEMAVETFDALLAERGDTGKIWASVLKEAIKRRKPDFNESYYGFRAFGNLLEEAQARGLMEFGRDEKSGAYVYRSNSAAERGESAAERVTAPASAASAVSAEQDQVRREPRRKGRSRGKGGDKPADGGPARMDTGATSQAESQPNSAAFHTAPFNAPPLNTTPADADPFNANPFNAHPADAPASRAAALAPWDIEDDAGEPDAEGKPSPSARRRASRGRASKKAVAEAATESAIEAAVDAAPQTPIQTAPPTATPAKAHTGRQRASRPAGAGTAPRAERAVKPAIPMTEATADPVEKADKPAAKPARKTPARPRRPRKPANEES